MLHCQVKHLKACMLYIYIYIYLCMSNPLAKCFLKLWKAYTLPSTKKWHLLSLYFLYWLFLMLLWVVVLGFFPQEFGEAGLAQGQHKVVLPTKYIYFLAWLVCLLSVWMWLLSPAPTPTKGISFFSFACLFTFCLIECGFSPHPTQHPHFKNKKLIGLFSILSG